MFSTISTATAAAAATVGVIQLARLAVADCDLSLFGKGPAPPNAFKDKVRADKFQEALD